MIGAFCLGLDWVGDPVNCRFYFYINIWIESVIKRYTPYIVFLEIQIYSFASFMHLSRECLMNPKY